MVLGLMTQALRLEIHGSDSSWGQLKLNCVFKGILEDMITENMVEFLIYRPVLGEPQPSLGRTGLDLQHCSTRIQFMLFAGRNVQGRGGQGEGDEEQPRQHLSGRHPAEQVGAHRKQFSPSGIRAILESPRSPPWGGGGTEIFEFRGFCCHLFIFLASEE